MSLEYILDIGSADRIESINFGPGSKSLAVKQVTEIAISTWPYKVEIEDWANFISGGKEAESLDLNSFKASEILKWSPTWTQEEAIRATFRWWDEVLNLGLKPLESCKSDIEYILKNSVYVEPQSVGTQINKLK